MKKNVVILNKGILKHSRIIISLGGSLVAPASIDLRFLKQFKNFIEAKIKEHWRFIIVVGGGKTAREYQQAAQKLSGISRNDLDWLGIHATRINAHLLRTIFKRYSYSHVVTKPHIKEGMRYQIIIASGTKPGWSTDYVSVLLAKTYGIKAILNLSNISYVFTRDPRRFRNATPLRDMRWRQFRKLVGSRWNPGANLPFDPVASRLAEKLNLTVIVLSGKHMGNINKVLHGNSFHGTILH